MLALDLSTSVFTELSTFLHYVLAGFAVCFFHGDLVFNFDVACCPSLIVLRLTVWQYIRNDKVYVTVGVESTKANDRLISHNTTRPFNTTRFTFYSETLG